GDENFIQHTIADSFNGAWSVHAIDLDDDYDVDVLGAAYSANEITWWENNLDPVVQDVGTISIDISSSLPEDTTLNPQATVKNIGTDTETFDVTCEINPGGYSSTETVTDLTPGDSIQITFSPDFMFSAGPYTVTVYTQLPGDVNPANDSLVKIIETYDPGVTEEDSDKPIRFSFGLKNNPAQGHAVFNLVLSEATTVRLRIYDVSGRLVDEVLSGRKAAGYYSIPWTSQATAGIYFYKFEAPWQHKGGKLVFIR
ncbi:hypothetical protein AMJ52_01245, partial [candidate division TA06 bacterium DG_78]